jgi:dynein heavy chain
MGADNMMVVIERAMATGNSVLIENMGESIDAALNPVITRCVGGLALRVPTTSNTG